MREDFEDRKNSEFDNLHRRKFQMPLTKPLRLRLFIDVLEMEMPTS
jgi:hypothetical protein